MSLLIWVVTIVGLIILLSLIFGTVGYWFDGNGSTWFEYIIHMVWILVFLSPFLVLIIGCSIDYSSQKYKVYKYAIEKHPIIALQDMNTQDVSGSYVIMVGDFSTSNNSYCDTPQAEALGLLLRSVVSKTQ